MKILDTSALVEQSEENDDDTDTICNDMVQNSTKKSIFLAHRNLSRKKCLLAVGNNSEIHRNTSELATQNCPNSIPDGKAYGSDRSRNVVDVDECDHEPSAGNLCNNNINVISDDHKLMEETISLHICKQSLKDDDSATNHSSLVNTLLKTSSDDDKDCNINRDSNLLTDGSTSLSSDTSKEPSGSQSITSANHSEATNNTKVSLNPLDNNNDSLKNVIVGGSELPLPEHVCKEMSQGTECASSCYNDSANTSKPFKLPILEKMPKTASIQQPEVEENAVALLDSAFTRQNQLEEVRCLDLEPRSSNSSEESNSDVESQHASTSNNDVKKVSESYILSLFFLEK